MKVAPYVWGFDPGNTSSGVALFRGQDLLFSATVKPHTDPGWAYEATPLCLGGVRHVVYCEVPQNGTHTSRGGVHWAGGMLLSHLNVALLPKPIPRGNIRKVIPNMWRKWCSLPTKAPEGGDLKDMAMALVEEKFGLVPDSDDEAEATLLAWSGSIREGTF